MSTHWLFAALFAKVYGLQKRWLVGRLKKIDG